MNTVGGGENNAIIIPSHTLGIYITLVHTCI